MSITEILFSRKKEWTTDTWYSTNEPWKQNAKWQKPVKIPRVFWSYSYEMFRTGRSMELEGKLVVASGWGWWGYIEVIAKGCGLSFGDDENVLKLTIVMIVPICEYTRNHRYFLLYTAIGCNYNCKWVNCAVCEWYKKLLKKKRTRK